jgi:hypothetical protein
MAMAAMATALAKAEDEEVEEEQQHDQAQWAGPQRALRGRECGLLLVGLN